MLLQPQTAGGASRAPKAADKIVDGELPSSCVFEFKLDKRAHRESVSDLPCNVRREEGNPL